MTTDISFESYKRMIWNKAHKLSKRYNLEWNDVASQGYLIFVKTLRKFDPTKASFSTYLYHNLRDLNNYCIKQQKLIGLELDYENLLSENIYLNDIENFNKVLSKVEENKELSKESIAILKYIIERDWEKPGMKPHKVSFSMVTNYFRNKGWGQSILNDCWEELHIWWNTCYYLY